MKYIIVCAAAILLFSCNQTGADKTATNDTAAVSKADSLKPSGAADSTPENDSAILFRKASEILTAVKNSNYQSFAGFIHPQLGCRFSPYAYVDTVENKKLLPGEFITLQKQNKKMDWGSAFSEDPELLTVKEYLAKFVYDVDFINAEFKSLNKFHNAGTDLNNIQKIYPQHNIVELFFSGFDKKYDGMDFRGLRLVFKTSDKTPYLVGVVHHQWTP
jgi:hypothetical protein